MPQQGRHYFLKALSRSADIAVSFIRLAHRLLSMTNSLRFAPSITCERRRLNLSRSAFQDDYAGSDGRAAAGARGRRLDVRAAQTADDDFAADYYVVYSQQSPGKWPPASPLAFMPGARV